MTDHTEMENQDSMTSAFRRAMCQKRRQERRERSLQNFLTWWTNRDIQEKLSRHVMEQPQLLEAVADFLRYHALRQLYPDLPMRPMLVTGPSGCGKTEVWRCVQRLFSDVFHVTIADGSCITSEGWSGSTKFRSFLTNDMANGGILVIDEFDKLVTPTYSSSGDNVSYRIQAELLKLMEGDAVSMDHGKITSVTFENIGIVMTGAFASLHQSPKTRSQEVGFLSAPKAAPSRQIQEEDLIQYGIMPEILGRIAVRTQVHDLDAAAYRRILLSEHSRVSQLLKVLKTQNLEFGDLISSQELDSLISVSKSEHLGVRWVSAQVESRILKRMRTVRFLFPREEEDLDLASDF